MNLRRATLSSSIIIEGIVLLAVMVVINWVSCVNGTRLDLTENQEFTLSPATREVLANLDEIVNVKAYISSDLPPQFQPTRRAITEMLEQMDAVASDKFQLTVFDPSDPEFDAAKENLQFKGIQPIQFEAREKGGGTVTKQGFLGLYITRITKSDMLPAVISDRTLEYDLISKIVKMGKTENEAGRISFTQGGGEPSMEEDGGYKQAIADMRAAGYTIFASTLDGKNEIPSTVTTLIVANPTTMAEVDKYQIDQYVMRGGNVIFMVDPIDISSEQGPVDLNATPKLRPNAVGDLLEHYGVRVEPKLVGDLSADNIQYSTSEYQLMPYNHPYPYWVKTLNSALSQEHPAVNRLEVLYFPWTAPIKVLDDKLKAHPAASAEILASSSVAAFAKDPTGEDFAGMSPVEFRQGVTTPPDNVRYPVMVELHGTFKSFYAGKPDPSDGKFPSGERTRLDESEKPGRILVIGNDKLFLAPFWARPQWAPNQTFTYNVFDYLNLGEDLLGLRSRQQKFRPLEKQWIDPLQTQERQVDEKDQRNITLLNIFGMPALIALFAMFRFGARAAAKRRYEKKMREELQLVSGLSAAEREELARFRPPAVSYVMPLVNIGLLLLVFGGLFYFVIREVKETEKARKKIIAGQNEKMFPTFKGDTVCKIEIREIMSKTVFEKRGSTWFVGRVGYPEGPATSSETKDTLMPKPEELAPADPAAIEAMFNTIGQMPRGTLMAGPEDNENKIQMYVGVIGSEFRMVDCEGKAIIRFNVGKTKDDFSATYVQMTKLDGEGDEGVYEVPMYLESVFKKKSVLDWWDPHLYNMTADQLGKIVVSEKGVPVVTVEKAGAGWSVTSHPDWALDPAKLTSFVEFVADLKVNSWPEDFESMQFREQPPDWSSALTVEVYVAGSPTPMPSLQILDNQAAMVMGGILARMGEGVVFHLKQPDVERLRVKPSDFAPAGGPATPAESAPEAPAAGE